VILVVLVEFVVDVVVVVVVVVVHTTGGGALFDVANRTIALFAPIVTESRLNGNTSAKRCIGDVLRCDILLCTFRRKTLDR